MGGVGWKCQVRVPASLLALCCTRGTMAERLKGCGLLHFCDNRCCYGGCLLLFPLPQARGGR